MCEHASSGCTRAVSGRSPVPWGREIGAHSFPEGTRMTLSLFGAPRGARLRAARASSFRPSVEALEDRALPSFVPSLIHGVTPVAHVSHAMKLVGNVSGSWSAQSSLIPDIGTTQALHGSG